MKVLVTYILRLFWFHFVPMNAGLFDANSKKAPERGKKT